MWEVNKKDFLNSGSSKLCFIGWNEKGRLINEQKVFSLVSNNGVHMKYFPIVIILFLRFSLIMQFCFPIKYSLIIPNFYYLPSIIPILSFAIFVAYKVAYWIVRRMIEKATVFFVITPITLKFYM